MKKTIIILALLVTVISILFSCKEEKRVHNFIPKSDTMQTLALYKPSGRQITFGIIYRITKDTFKVSYQSEKIQWTRDTLYYAPVTDTIRDAATRKPQLDSTGKAKIYTQYLLINKSFVWVDADKNIDSVLKSHN